MRIEYNFFIISKQKLYEIKVLGVIFEVMFSFCSLNMPIHNDFGKLFSSYP